MRRVEWSDRAVSDLQGIRAYLTETFSAEFASRIINQLVLATYFLLDYPEAGPKLDVERWRKWKPRKSRHVLIYVPTPNGIDILRVRHERNDWRPVPE